MRFLAALNRIGGAGRSVVHGDRYRLFDEKTPSSPLHATGDRQTIASMAHVTRIVMVFFINFSFSSVFFTANRYIIT